VFNSALEAAADDIHLYCQYSEILVPFILWPKEAIGFAIP
jgi:hypothetical protein